MASLNALDLFIVAREVDGLIKGRQVRDIRSSNNEIWIRLNSPPHLRIILHPSFLGVALHDTVEGEVHPHTPMLRKRRIQGVRARPGDRVLVIHLGDRGLVIELTGKHRNLLILDEETRVLASVFPVRMPFGTPYTFPPPPPQSFWEVLQHPHHRHRVAAYASRIQDIDTYVCQALDRPQPVVILSETSEGFVAPRPIPLQEGERAIPVATIAEGFDLLWDMWKSQQSSSPPPRAFKDEEHVKNQLKEEMDRLSNYDLYRVLAERLLHEQPAETDRVFREGNVEILLSAGEDPIQRAQDLFKQYRKAKRGYEKVRARFMHLASRSSESFDHRDHPFPPSPSTPLEGRRPYRVYRGPDGGRILVGKSAKDNHQLTFHRASAEAWWLHAKDVSGSHVVVPDPKVTEVDLEEAARLALYFSKARTSGSGDVWITRRKWVRSVRGKPGKVQILKGEVRRISLPPGWQPTPAEA